VEPRGPSVLLNWTLTFCSITGSLRTDLFTSLRLQGEQFTTSNPRPAINDEQGQVVPWEETPLLQWHRFSGGTNSVAVPGAATGHKNAARRFCVGRRVGWRMGHTCSGASESKAFVMAAMVEE